VCVCVWWVCVYDAGGECACFAQKDKGAVQSMMEIQKDYLG